MKKKLVLLSLARYLGVAVIIGASVFVVLQILPANPMNSRSAGAAALSAQGTSEYPAPVHTAPENSLGFQDTEPYPVHRDPTPFIDYCADAGKWIEYVDEQTGLSFRYPAESKFDKDVDPNGYPWFTITLNTGCYSKECLKTMTLGIAVFPNKEKLPIFDFVLERFSLNYPDEEEAIAKEIDFVSVDQVDAVRINGSFTREVPKVYIPKDDLVYFVGFSEMTNMPPFEQPCPTTMDLFEKILQSVKFSS